jgi:beta-N-acetylhexosaminidase
MSKKLERREFIKLAGMALIAGCTPDSPELLTTSSISKLAASNSQTGLSDNLDAKIGQMLLVGFRGLEISSETNSIIQDIQKLHIGGVILYDYDVAENKPVRNIKSPEQVKKLIQNLQKYSEIPLFIGIDYEGGIVNRLPQKYGFPTTVSHQHLGKKNDSSLTELYATLMAQTLSELGINLNFAPVVDVNKNPNNPIIAKKERSFSDDPLIVTKHAQAFIKAHHKENVICVLKHFPGHGSAKADSHLGMVDVSNTWSSMELIPYQQLIKAGQVEAIMTGHIFNKSIDSKMPATLSKSTITGLLRQKLKFNGVVISDNIQMKAISNNYGLETAIKKTIEAGVDIIMIGNNTEHFEPNLAKRVTLIIKKLIQKGKLSEARINESYQRIMKLKQGISK